MFKDLFSGKEGKKNSAIVQNSNVYKIDQEGLFFPFSLENEPDQWALTAYLNQLSEEDYVSQLSDRWLLSWDELYRLLDDSEHQTSLALLSLPEISNLQLNLSSQSSLVSDDFKVFVKSWINPVTNAEVQLDRTGAFVNYSGKDWLLPNANWQVLQAIQKLYLTQQMKPGEVTNQVGWSTIRKLAKQASAGMDGFLEKTIVIRPDSLKLKIRKSTLDNSPVIEIQPTFEGQPENWIASFDSQKQVQDRYRVVDPDGSLTHVMIEPEVKAVLESVRAMPGRRVAGDDALSFVKNPYTYLGDDAVKVIDADEYENELSNAGIYFHRFTLTPRFNVTGEFIDSVILNLEPISTPASPSIEKVFNAAHEFSPLVLELQLKLAAELPAGFWQGYELDLSDFNLQQLTAIESLLSRWTKEAQGAMFDSVMNISSYSDRVKGIGEAEKISSPFLIKETSENWLPADVADMGIDPQLLSQWDSSSRENFNEFERRLDIARAANDDTVCLPDSEISLQLPMAEKLFKAWQKKINENSSNSLSNEPQAGRAVLQIEHNIEEAKFLAQHRTTLLKEAMNAHAELPELLRTEIQLREHQLKGVAWLQYLFKLSPKDVSGCLLADDMGLGKTLQILTFLVWYIEKYPNDKPTLIIAPVSLLDNWERELSRFFYADALSVLKLYGGTLGAVKFKKEEIPADLRAKGIKNLLRPGWIGDAKIVLTTYETLRDQEFSFARQEWAIVVCDEAQKIKNPAALITQAAKAVPSRFKVACTGTPVENTLIDLWCLFDFIQPGFLGGLNQFGRDYQRPIESTIDRDTVAVERLRDLIEPQTLRRMKQDVAKDLPAKIEDGACRSLLMSGLQKTLYLSEITGYSQKQQMEEHLEQKSSGMLGLLHKLKLICAHPYSVQPDPRLRDNSPKLLWLLETLKSIKSSGKGDKVIIFSELRDIQRELQHTILEHFGIRATVINGETSTSSQSAQSRQKLIDEFQQQPGFGVIILSTLAVGFGVNVQAANHVIHFTRCWNPAKEDQATDRAYRIGQEKDVYVYYPTVRDSSMNTFEATLDELLEKRRSLARDMLSGSQDIQMSEFGELLRI